ncbi:ABC transporter substrate-binding protein [Bradyrhizobium sp. BRP20]|uniref:ABC transporter substrate-binding protein n=1 Tax=Bradyrhizobium sp. BRP20 TaxID=2793822 RepID=UPI001CD5DF55|nr:ABC transporter substrate-binding protein [Bradyrhizobium sp. BRP20]MCA1435289.1 ABC transporter substrate-binding protein [Bradyrhizobium sp. BRP20]
MRRRQFVKFIGGVALAWPLSARAQPVGKLYRIGYFNAGAAAAQGGVGLERAFAEALRELGWMEGTNVAFEYRFAEGHSDRLPGMATELVHLKVDVIVANGTLASLAAKQATSTIPIVTAPAGDPLGSGLVPSLAHPGGNVTGLSLMAPDLGGKRLELLKELLPDVSRAAILWNAANPYAADVFRETDRAARTLRVTLQSLEVRSLDDFDTAFEAAKVQRPEGLITVEDPLTVRYRKQIVDFAARNRLPAIHGVREFVEAGGLIAYGASLSDLSRRAATYVDKILKGTKPADLPVQQPTKFEFIVNLSAAKALGLTMPPSLLARADEVIE